MKTALINLANFALTQWATLKAFGTGKSNPRFPTIVAQTTEGQLMNGPCGLRLITQRGPALVDETPSGFWVYQPTTHRLKLL